MEASALSYIKAINDKAGLNVLDSKIFKAGLFNIYALDNNDIKVSGTKPDDAMVCLNDYKVVNACLDYGKYKVEYENNGVKRISKGKCKSESFSCDVSPLKTYEYTGDYQEFVAPHDGDYKIDLWGAQGGSSDDAAGGKGAYTSGIIHLDKGDELYIYVGGAGSSRTYNDGTGSIAGGYNGGGAGNVSRTNYNQKNGSGGGATDVRLVSGAWNNATSLRSRIMVAAGGAGIYSATGSSGVQAPAGGGYGGALTGGSSYYYGSLDGYSSLTPSGGTQTTGGQSVNEWNRTWYENTYIGGFGYGATGANSYGGAGGGYWGGASGNWKPGAGGSSYISGYKGCVAVASSESNSPKSGCSNGTTNVECSYHYSGKKFRKITMKSGKEEMPTHDNLSTMTGNEGNGYAAIYDAYYLDEKPVYSSLNEEYTYTGTEQKFIAPKNGTYKLEVWGAQGGSGYNNDTGTGGYGGYSTGTISLNVGDKLYINVGGAGGSTTSKTQDATGGYNGGGNSYHWVDGSTYNGAGGGATSVATMSGTLFTLESSINKIIIVAGGGGGGASDGSSHAKGGSGGGYVGVNGQNPPNGDGSKGLGGTQSSGGSYERFNRATPSSGTFGQGANSTLSNASDGGGGAGGGGGFYGGGSAGVWGGAGGGSGYIANSLLSNKEMKCYNCTESTDEDTKTTSVDCTDDIANSNCAKKGNGYAKITFVN